MSVNKDGNASTSQCHGCQQQKEPVPRGEELYVHICRFSCNNGHPLRKYTVRCKMSNTAPCYECGAQVNPHSFSPLRRINKHTDNEHNCSECNGGPNCPNMKPQLDEGAPIPPLSSSPALKEVMKQSGATVSSQYGWLKTWIVILMSYIMFLYSVNQLYQREHMNHTFCNSF